MTGLPWADDEGDEPGTWFPNWEGWPEDLAGPEYWLYKKQQDEEVDDDDPSGRDPPG